MERRSSSRKVQIREKQTRAELRNKQKTIDRLIKDEKPIPTVLFERVAELHERLIK